MDAAARKRRARQSARKSAQRSVELPTLALVFLVYGGWLGVTLAYSHWPLWIVALLAAPLITLHSSLQHEILHGHPTRWRRLNRLIGIVPLSLWLPYERYRQTHLVHHVDERLTDPLDDPEVVLLGARAMAAIEFAAAVSRAVANDAGRPDFDWTLLERLAFLAIRVDRYLAQSGAPAQNMVGASHLVCSRRVLGHLRLPDANLDLCPHDDRPGNRPALDPLVRRTSGEARRSRADGDRRGFLDSRTLVPLQQPPFGAPRRADDGLVRVQQAIPRPPRRIPPGEWRARLSKLFRRGAPVPVPAA